MTSDLCFECDNRRLTLFYPHVERLVAGGFIPFGDLSAGGWFQRVCPYCADEGPPTTFGFTLLLPAGGLKYE